MLSATIKSDSSVASSSPLTVKSVGSKVSTVITSTSSSDLFPAISIATKVMLVLPSANSFVRVISYSPFSFIKIVSVWEVPSLSVNVSSNVVFASPTPLNVGVVSETIKSVSSDVSSSPLTRVSVGVCAFVKSNVISFVASLVFPASSSTVTLKAVLPSDCSSAVYCQESLTNSNVPVVLSTIQSESKSALVAFANSTPSTDMITDTLSASTLFTVNIGVLSLVILSVLLLPVSMSNVKFVSDIVLSITNSTTSIFAPTLVFPNASSRCTWIRCVDSCKSTSGL